MTRRKGGYAWIWALMALIGTGLTVFILASGGNPWIAAVLAFFVGWDVHTWSVELFRTRR